MLKELWYKLFPTKEMKMMKKRLETISRISKQEPTGYVPSKETKEEMLKRLQEDFETRLRLKELAEQNKVLKKVM